MTGGENIRTSKWQDLRLIKIYHGNAYSLAGNPLYDGTEFTRRGETMARKSKDRGGEKTKPPKKQKSS
jgi:hypothetical protein